MSSANHVISRPIVGLSALVCLSLWLGMFFIPPVDDGAAASERQSRELWQGSFLRVGLVMGAFWLALPSRRREAAWAGISPGTFLALIFAAFLAARFRQAVIPIIVGVAMIGRFVRPRQKDRPRERPV